MIWPGILLNTECSSHPDSAVRFPSPNHHGRACQSHEDSNSAIIGSHVSLTDLLDPALAGKGLELLKQRNTAEPRSINEDNSKLEDIAQTDDAIWNSCSNPTVGLVRSTLDAPWSTVSPDSSQSIRDETFSVTWSSFILDSRRSDKETLDYDLSTESDSRWEITTVSETLRSESTSGNTETASESLARWRQSGVRCGPLSPKKAAHARTMPKIRACWPCRMVKIIVSFSIKVF
jgi:hypothetical protein